jgi:Cu2+-exporting ATPase
MSGESSREANAEDRTACAHCALPVPPALIDPDGDLQFCCHGCRTVYQAIHACGLQRFYDLRDPADAGFQANPTEGRYEYLNEAAFQDQHVRALPSGHALVELYLEGLHCAACVWLIERLPQVQQGVIEARVDIRRQLVALSWDAQKVDLSRLARQLDSLGYPAHPYRGGEMHDIRRRETRQQLVRIAVAGAIAGNVMLISFALFGGMFAPMEPQYRTLFRWYSLGLTVLALIWPGRPFLVGALSALRTRTAHMDLPVAIALLAGTLWGAVNTVRGTGETYFESLTAVIFLLLVGRYVLFRQQRTAQDSIELLFTLTPTTARLIEDGAVREVPVESLKPGSQVELRGGDSVPADGVIADGRSDFDFSLLTGESRPVRLGPGDRIYAGTHNLSARIVLDVSSPWCVWQTVSRISSSSQFCFSPPSPP